MNHLNQGSSISSLVFTQSCFTNLPRDTAVLQKLANEYDLMLIPGDDLAVLPAAILANFCDAIPGTDISASLRKLTQSTAAPLNQSILIGTDYYREILPALSAGMKTTWLNPKCICAPGLLPLHSYDIEHLDQLSSALQQDEVPSYRTCLFLLLQNDCSANVLAHVQLVANVAYLIACMLRASNTQVDPLIVHRAGMLHDIAKIRSLGSDKDHGIQGSELLIELGLPVYAEITRRHVLNSILNSSRRPRSWEEKLVYFADKVAESVKLVPVQDRIQKLSERYSAYQEEIQLCLEPVLGLQDEICGILGLNPDELFAHLKKSVKRNSITAG